MIDVALGIEAIYYGAKYFGVTTANTKECFDELNWQDERPKPTWEQVVEAYNQLPEEIKYPEIAKQTAKVALLNRLGLTEDEAKLLLI